jgi:thiosulfate dehydrogenase [quinone] large subunit
MSTMMPKALVLYFRFVMAWTFLYAASHQVFVPGWTVFGFLNHTKTFHDFFAIFTTPTMAPITTFFVEYGHLLIGLSLLAGLMVRVSAAFGVVLMITYWFAHMDWPFIENTNNFIVDYHLVYAGVLVTLIVTRAGHVFGLDVREGPQFQKQHPRPSRQRPDEWWVDKYEGNVRLAFLSVCQLLDMAVGARNVAFEGKGDIARTCCNRGSLVSICLKLLRNFGTIDRPMNLKAGNEQ